MPSNQPYRCRKMTLNMTATNSGSPDSDTESNLDNVDDNDEDIRHATARRGTTERPATARERANQLAQRVYGCPAPRPRRDGNGVPLPRRPNPQRLKRKYASPRESRAHERFIRKEQLNLLGIDGGPQSIEALEIISNMLGDRQQYYAGVKEVSMLMIYEAAYIQRWEIASGLEGHAALVQASERDYTEVTPYFLRIPTLEDVERVRKRARNMSRTRAAAPPLSEADRADAV